MNQFPEIMKNAREDLGATVSGRFSPTDWEQILVRAHALWREQLALVNGDELKAWHAVVLDFHRNRQWGFQANYKEPARSRKEMNLGVKFIWITFQTFVITKIAVVWLGQIYARSQDPVDGILLYFVIALVLANFGWFLWRHRGHQD